MVLEVLADARELSTMGSIPCSRSCSAGPIPDSISSCGLPIAPAESTTSRFARATRSRPRESRQRTPEARPSVQVDPERLGLRRHGQVRALRRRAQVGVGGAPATAVALADRGLRDAVLLLGVDVGVARDPGALGRLEEARGQGPRLDLVGDVDRAAAAVHGRIPGGLVVLHALVVGQDVLASPSHRSPPRASRRSRAAARARTSSRSSSWSRPGSCRAARTARGRRGAARARCCSPSRAWS